MSLERFAYLPEGTRVTFELRGALPILREEYRSLQAGTVVLKGFFNQTKLGINIMKKPGGLTADIQRMGIKKSGNIIYMITLKIAITEKAQQQKR